MNHKWIWAGSFSALIATTAGAYEVGTHALITHEASARSVLSRTHPQSIQPVLGFDRLDEKYPFNAPFGGDPLESGYYDTTAPIDPIPGSASSILFTRVPQQLESNIFEGLIARGFFPGPVDDFKYRTEAWLMRGVIREDDNDLLVWSVGARDEDPHGNIFRANRHFYDPVNNRSADGPDFFCPTFGCVRSSEWMMGRTELGNGVGNADTARRGHFSWEDARNHYWWALTMVRDEGDGGRDASERERDSQERAWHWATAVSSLGHVIHLLQDTAQPQHTRNDGHSPPVLTSVSADSAEEGTFEAYTEGRLFGDSGSFSPAMNNMLYMDGGRPQESQLPAIVLGKRSPYPIPRFRLPLHYMTTRSENAGIPDRRGLADYSNRGFFTSGSMPLSVSLLPDEDPNHFTRPELPSESPSSYQVVEASSGLSVAGIEVKVTDYLAVVPDTLNPNYDTQSGYLAAYAGKVPLLRRGMFFAGSDLIQNPNADLDNAGFFLHYANLRYQADTLVPRAVAYSAGMLDYFFRGRLEVTPPPQGVLGVINQGETHTVDSDGYPRQGDDIFGFTKIRLRVRNITESITESGVPGPAVVQGSGNGTLVAVARYHRNACYKADMSGERQIGFAVPPAVGAITEPACGGAVTRTDFQEISVSEPLTVDSTSDLPGGQGTGGPAAVDKVFDFSDDPIPVNATDLFIQVVYRGQLGDEPDGVAVGNYDAREPTFIGIANHTDYFWNPSPMQWVAQSPNGPFPQKNMDAVRVCVGGSWVYNGFVVGGVPPLGFPAPDPGVIRLAMIFAKPSPATQQFTVRVTPVVFGGPPSPDDRLYFTRGQQHQANKERIETSVLQAPLICTETAPAAAAYWCDTPIKKRRGHPFGEVTAMVAYVNGFGTPADSDTPPALPVFPGVDITTTGDIKFDDPTLANCPPAPMPPAAP